MTVQYVLDTGALIAQERGKHRVARFFQLAYAGSARLIVPLPVVTEWWRGRTDAREEILAATIVHASLEVAMAAGLALGHVRGGRPGLAVDAFVLATAAVLGAVVVTSDPDDFEPLCGHFPGVTVLST